MQHTIEKGPNMHIMKKYCAKVKVHIHSDSSYITNYTNDNRGMHCVCIYRLCLYPRDPDPTLLSREVIMFA